jgi:hypothetical protein
MARQPGLPTCFGVAAELGVGGIIIHRIPDPAEIYPEIILDIRKRSLQPPVACGMLGQPHLMFGNP